MNDEGYAQFETIFPGMPVLYPTAVLHGLMTVKDITLDEQPTSI